MKLTIITLTLFLTSCGDYDAGRPSKTEQDRAHVTIDLPSNYEISADGPQHDIKPPPN